PSHPNANVRARRKRVPGSLDVNDSVARCPAGGVALAVPALDQDLELPSDKATVGLGLKVFLERKKASQSVFGHRRGNGLLSPPPRRGRSRPGRIAEGEDVGKADPTDELECRGEVVLRLPRETHDEIGGDRNLRQAAADAFDGLDVTRAVVPPLHAKENAVGA